MLLACSTGAQGSAALTGTQPRGGVRRRSRAAGDAGASNTRVDRFEESCAGLVSCRNDDAAITHVKSREIRQIAYKRRQSLPPQPKGQGEPVVEAPFVLRVDAGLNRMGVNVRAGLRNIGFGWQA